MPEVAISNTSPIQYLHQLNLIHLLPHFYQQVVIPPAVAEELSTGRSLGIDLPDLTALTWLRVRPPVQTQPLSLATTLGIGERQALALASEISDSLLIMDNGRGRRMGQLLSLKMTGTVGIAARGVREGLIPQLLPILNRLESLGFRLSAEAKATALKLVRESE
jgi:predicted nucleic acid-binding protein